MIAPLLTPAQRSERPDRVARVCVNGHLADPNVPLADATSIDVNRADPLAVATTGVRCEVCGAGTIVGCPGCGYPIPGRADRLAFAVPHFCIVCGEFYPWTFRGEFYGTLAEILDEAPELEGDARHDALGRLDRVQDGVASPADVAGLVETFRSLGGSDWELAAQILDVVLPPDVRATIDLRLRGAPTSGGSAPD